MQTRQEKQANNLQAAKRRHETDKAGLRDAIRLTPDARLTAAQKRRLKIGVIIFENSNPFFDEVMKGVRYQQQRLNGYNCSVLVR